METIYLLSPITVISLKAIDLSNRGWNVVTPSDRILKLSPSATTFYTVNKHILSTRGQQVYSCLKNLHLWG